MRVRFASLFALALFLSVSTQAQIAQVSFDTLVVRPVGPGMTYYRIVAPAVPWDINVLELDRTDPYLEIKSVEAFDRRVGGYETTSSIAARLDAPGHWVVGAINGDFFGGNGETNSVGISEGQVVRRERPGYPSVGFDVDNVAFLSRPALGGEVRTPTGSIPISGYNEPRGEDALVVYNSFRGTSTGANEFGTEVLVRPTSAWVVNDTVEAVVEAVEVGVGDMEIPEGWAVLSAHGSAADVLAGVAAGEAIRIYQRAVPGLPDVEDMISGNPILVLDGVPDPLDNGAFNTDRHPRTAVGFNADTTRIYFVTVDGRQASSAGMTNFELRDFMVRLGAADAINLDGGGSTTMVLRGDIANSPSGLERSVGNALLAVSTAPLGALERLQPTPTYASVFLGNTVQIETAGADEHYNPIEIDLTALSFSVDPALGTVTPGGLFTASTSKTAGGTGYVRVAYGGLVDSVRVEVKGVGRIDVSPESAVTDTTRALAFSVSAYDTSGLPQAVPATEIAWEVLDPSVGTVTDEGHFRGVAEGTARVVAVYTEAIRDTSWVRVEVGQGDVVLDPLDEADGWSVTGENVDAVTLEAVDDPAAAGGRALRVRYRFVRESGTLPSITLHSDLPVYGVPDSVTVRARSGGERHRVLFLYENGAGEPFSVSVPRYADDEAYAPMPGPFTRAVPSAALAFPVRLVGIEVPLSTTGTTVGETYEGTLHFDDLQASYPAGATSSAGGPTPPGLFALTGVYPNPSRTSATVAFRTGAPGPVRLVLYDTLGRAVLTAYEGLAGAGDQVVDVDVSGLPSGVYVLRAAGGGGGASTKLMVIR